MTRTYRLRRLAMLTCLALGITTICIGLGLLSPPLALIVAGAAIAAFGLLAIEVSP